MSKCVQEESRAVHEERGTVRLDSSCIPRAGKMERQVETGCKGPWLSERQAGSRDDGNHGPGSNGLWTR